MKRLIVLVAYLVRRTVERVGLTQVVGEKAVSLSTKEVLNSRLDTWQQTQLSRWLKPRKVALSTVASTPAHTRVDFVAVAPL